MKNIVWTHENFYGSAMIFFFYQILGQYKAT